MSSSAADVDRLTVALIGNPNSGKTTVFNALTGLRHKVGNYPGVTVERVEGETELTGVGRVRVIDLPGTYSLTGRSPDEDIAVGVIAGAVPGTPRPDVLVNVCDATTLGRSLYLTSQLFELDVPVVCVLTMMDVAARRGLTPDVGALSRELGVAVVAVDARHRQGLEDLATAIREAVVERSAPRGVVHPPLIASAVARLREATAGALPDGVLLRALLAGSERASSTIDTLPDDQLSREREALAASDPDWWRREATARYDWVDGVLAKAGAAPPAPESESPSRSERIDRWLLHKFFGPVFFVFVMAVVFQAVFTWAEPAMDALNAGFDRLGTWTRATLGEGLFTDFVVDGALAGVLNVLVFLPQILLLFTAIALLEDSGYMARAAVITDRLMRRVGLHGKSFLPLMSSFACAVPGVMATRTIESWSARLTTILVAPLMTCSARLPVYTLIIGAFFGGTTILGGVSVGALLMIGLYVAGIVAAITMAFVFRRTLARGATPPLVMELPAYRMPLPGAILRTVFDRGMIFVRRAGTVILAISLVLWVLATFPRHTPAAERYSQRIATLAASGADDAEIHELERELASIQLKESYAGRLGRFVEPVLSPLGFDWRLGIGIVASFAAREVLVSSLGCVFAIEDPEESGFTNLQQVLRSSPRSPQDSTPAYRPLTGLSILIFFVLACQCMSTIAVVRRETNTWRWPAFLFFYMTGLAWLASFGVYQVGSALGF